MWLMGCSAIPFAYRRSSFARDELLSLARIGTLQASFDLLKPKSNTDYRGKSFLQSRLFDNLGPNCRKHRFAGIAFVRHQDASSEHSISL
jgi:hypothetical protein